MIQQNNPTSNEDGSMENFLEQLFSSMNPQKSGDISQLTLAMHTQLIIKAMSTAIMGSVLSYFAALQTILLLFRITGDITWPWVTVFCPMVVMVIFYFVRRKYFSIKAKTEIDKLDNMLATEGNSTEAQEIKGMLENMLGAIGKDRNSL